MNFTGGYRSGVQIDRNAPKRTYKYTKKDCDLILGIDTRTSECYIIPIEDTQEWDNTKSLSQLQTPNAYLKTRYKSMQETGLEAELYFLNHYKNIEVFSCGSLKDMRLFGDGYDFYIQTNKQAFLVEVKGIREKQGALRLTQKEYDQAQAYNHDYVLVVVLNLSEKPYLLSIANPLKHLEFKACERKQKSILEYHLIGQIK
ncbi:hypothetical protein TH0156_03200 [Helicobacter pylori]